MSQVRKTIFTVLVLMLGAGHLSGCGIQGDLYAPGSTDQQETSDATEQAPVAE